MNKVNLSLVIALMISITSTVALLITEYNFEESPYEYLDPELDGAKAFTLEVLEGFSEEDYDFKPAEEMRTFREQAYHIAYSLEWFNGQMNGNPIQWSPGEEDLLSKEELITYTTEQFEAFISIIKDGEESGPRTRGILATLRHNSHHRGQMVAYYRANDMTPPSYQ